MMASRLYRSIVLLITSVISLIAACPGRQMGEILEPTQPCNTDEPKCPTNSYCYPYKMEGFWVFQWVCCPNMTAPVVQPPPGSPPLFPQPPQAPSPPNLPPNSNHLIVNPIRKSKGIPITIPFNDAARQQVPYAIMSLVQEQIQRYPVIMFSLSSCPWCTRAKELLDDYYPNLTYYYFDYDLNPDGNPIANAAMGVSGMRTVPMIYVCQQLIGGFTDLQNLHVAHELQSRIQKCTSS